MSELKQVMKFFLDPGHGGTNKGVCKNGIVEKDWNWEFCKRVKELGPEMKIEVIPTSQGMSFSGRKAWVKDRAVEKNLVISIHVNSGEEKFRGSQIYYSGNYMKKWARILQKYLPFGLKWNTKTLFDTNRAVPGSWLERPDNVLHTFSDISDCLLLECYFASNLEDVELMKDPNGPMARLLAEGILDFIFQWQLQRGFEACLNEE